MYDLQRHLSDSLAFVPRQPSMLGPGRSRGTVSLPTSPTLGTRKTNLLWAQPSARALLESVPEHSWFSRPWPSTSGSAHIATQGSQSPVEERQTTNSNPMRKKRAQVRIACTHCQKACKKCSNTRPCERCVKYGLRDCIDSTRKPRKTGIKRGPYKRRTSARYDSFFESDSQMDHIEPYLLHVGTAAQMLQQAQGEVQAQVQPSGAAVNGYISPPDPQHAQPPPFQQQLSQPGPEPFSSDNRFDVPNTAALQGAFAEALAGPRWVHGQRTASPGSIGEVLYPPTPTVPFPVSLMHRNDPFSRAVSPIHSDLDSVLRGLKPMQTDKDLCQQALDSLSDLARPSTASGADINFQNPFDALSSGAAQTSYYSAPSSPVKTDLRIENGVRLNSASEPPTPISSTMHPKQTNPPRRTTQGEGLSSNVHWPAVIALKKVRKLSLRTLMSHEGSLAPSRQVSPVRELKDVSVQSPMLFDQPAIFDEVDVPLPIGAWAAFEPAVKEQQAEDTLGLLGLGLGPFQT